MSIFIGFNFFFFYTVFLNIMKLDNNGYDNTFA